MISYGEDMWFLFYCFSCFYLVFPRYYLSRKKNDKKWLDLLILIGQILMLCYSIYAFSQIESVRTMKLNYNLPKGSEYIFKDPLPLGFQLLSWLVIAVSIYYFGKKLLNKSKINSTFTL